MPSVHGEDAVIRILDKESISEHFRELRLDILGFPEQELKRFREVHRRAVRDGARHRPDRQRQDHHALRALSEIKSIEDKIVTIEDPVEYQLRGITQIPINEKKGLTFARGLRSILRHDPDKIMVGEIRDPETAQIAIQSALTGHLVFTTVHANNVLDVLGRFLNMGVEPYQFVSALNCVLAQRLVRNICMHCKRPAPPTEQQLIESALVPGADDTSQFFEGAGCIECGGTGFKGRTAICELLDLSDNIREMILARRPSSEIKKAAREEGMRFSARIGASNGSCNGDHDPARDQQGDLRRMSPHTPSGSARRPAWLASPPPTTALEISSRRVAAVGITGQGSGLAVAGYGTADLPDGAVEPAAERRQRARPGGAGRGHRHGARKHLAAAEARCAGAAGHHRQGVVDPVREGPRARPGSGSTDSLAGAEGGAVPPGRCAARLDPGCRCRRRWPRVHRHGRPARCRRAATSARARPPASTPGWSILRAST